MKGRMLLINFKNYLEASGDRALGLARAAERVSEELEAEIVVAPPLPFLALVARSVSIPVYSQHTDCAKPGSTTGHMVAEVEKSAGARGSIVNHSERRLDIDCIRQVVEKLRELGMVSVVCARTPDEVSRISELRPDYVAIEPPELIGTGIAVSKAKPEVIKDSLNAIKGDVKLLCGAGIVGYEDVKKAVELGAEGVLVASGIVKAKDWEGKIRELAEGLL